MKKIFLIMFCLIVSCNCVYASITDVLYETSIDSKTASSKIQSFLSKNKYKFEKPAAVDGKVNFYINPSTSATSEYIFITVSSAAKKTQIYCLNNGKQFNLKELDIKLNKIGDKKLMWSFRESALVAKANFDKRDLPKAKSETITYDFSDEAQQQHDLKTQAATKTETVVSAGQSKSNKQKTFVSAPAPVASQPIPAYTTNPSASKTLKGWIVNVPAGAVLDGALQSTVDSASLEKDDKVTATLSSDFIYKGVLVAPKGSLLYGKAFNVVHPKYAYGNGSMEIEFNRILTPKGSQINISTQKITLTAESRRTINVCKNILVGATIGAISGLLSGDASHVAKGAIIGASSGGIYAAAHKGENVSIPAGRPLQIKLVQPMNISVYD